MALAVVTGASCMCSFGAAPATFNVTSQMTITAEGKPMANITDNGLMNLPTFGMCTAPTNPAVVAALGSPVPCTYVQAGTWIPKQFKVMVGGKPALTNDCNCMCAYAGMITVANPGQTKVMI